MSDAQPTPRAYADLDAVRRILGWEDTDEGRDADLLLIARSVTAEIEDGLGVVWDGSTTDLKHERREVDVFGNVVSLRPPAYRIDGVDRDALPVTQVVYGTRSPDRGWFRELTLTGWLAIGAQRVGIDARWADDPGGDPPASVVAFANWATAQDWRRQAAGASGQLNPGDGYQVTVDNAWKTGGRWARLVEMFGLPGLKVWVL